MRPIYKHHEFRLKITILYSRNDDFIIKRCDRRDIRAHPVVAKIDEDGGESPPAIFMYDAIPAGGVAAKIKGNIEEIWRRAVSVIRECPCKVRAEEIYQSPACMYS